MKKKMDFSSIMHLRVYKKFLSKKTPQANTTDSRPPLYQRVLKEPLEQFDVKEYIAEGAFGKVYKSLFYKSIKRENKGVLVCLKIVKVTETGAFTENVDLLEKNEQEYVRGCMKKERCLAEIGLQKEASEHCPYIMKLNEVFLKDDAITQEFWITTKYCEFDLSQAFFARPDGFSILQIKIISSSIALALKYLRNEGIVHGDLKSSNVLLSSNGDVLLTDFGEAHRLSANRSMLEATRTFGTMGFIAPEVLTPYLIQDGFVEKDKLPSNTDLGKYGLKIDYWSFGCTLYEMFKGRTPIQIAYEKLGVNRYSKGGNIYYWCFRMNDQEDVNSNLSNLFYTMCELNSTANLTEKARKIVESHWSYTVYEEDMPPRLRDPFFFWPTNKLYDLDEDESFTVEDELSQIDIEECENLHDLARACIAPIKVRCDIDQIIEHDFLNETVSRLENNDLYLKKVIIDLVKETPLTKWFEKEEEMDTKPGRFGVLEPLISHHEQSVL